MTKLTLAIDKALGYYSSTSSTLLSNPIDSTVKQTDPSVSALNLSQLPTESLLEIQERWLDYPERYEAHQQEKWAEEGEWVVRQATQNSQAEAIQRNRTE